MFPRFLLIPPFSLAVDWGIHLFAHTKEAIWLRIQASSISLTPTNADSVKNVESSGPIKLRNLLWDPLNLRLFVYSDVYCWLGFSKIGVQKKKSLK